MRLAGRTVKQPVCTAWGVQADQRGSGAGEREPRAREEKHPVVSVTNGSNWHWNPSSDSSQSRLERLASFCFGSMWLYRSHGHTSFPPGTSRSPSCLTSATSKLQLSTETFFIWTELWRHHQNIWLIFTLFEARFFNSFCFTRSHNVDLVVILEHWFRNC